MNEPEFTSAEAEAVADSVALYKSRVKNMKKKYGVGEEAALAAGGNALNYPTDKIVRIEPIDADYIPGQEVHCPSCGRGHSPVFRPIDDLFLRGDSAHQTSESSDIGAGLSWMDSSRGRIGNTMEFIPGEEPDVNSAYAAAYTRQSHAQALTYNEKARLFFTESYSAAQMAGLKQLADSLVIAARPEPIEVKASFTLTASEIEIEIDADGNPTTLESAMALDAVDALCAAEDEAWKKELEEMEFDFSKESIVEMLNEELIAEGRDPFYSVQLLSAQAAAAVRKKQKARKKKRK